jgi:ABC-type lipoprotein release transport system permease subunit
MTPLFWIKIAFLFLVRSKRATLALGLMIFSAVGTLVFISAIAVGINDSMILNSTGLYSGHITGLQLDKTITKQRLFVKGVSNVLQRFQIPGTLYHQERKEIQTLIAVNPDQELNNTFLWKKIIKGNYIKDNQQEILISHHTAKQLDVHPGEKVIFKSGASVYPLIVAGIFKTGMDRFDNGIAFCPISILSVPPENWDCAIFINPGADLETIIDSYASTGVDTSLLKTWKELMPDLTQLIDLNRISMGFIMVLVLGVVCFGTACAFAIFIISNIREYGILKAMGVTPSETTLLIFSEVILLNIIAAFAGTIVGVTVVFITSKTGIDISNFTSHNQYFVVSGLIIPRSTLASLFLPSLLTLSFCLLAAIWPALIVIRQRSCDILRSI